MGVLSKLKLFSLGGESLMLLCTLRFASASETYGVTQSNSM